MPDIYLNKHTYLLVNRRNKYLNKFYVFLVTFGIILIMISMLKRNENEKISDNKIIIVENSVQNKTLSLQVNKFVDILNCKTYEKDYYQEDFRNILINMIFLKCLDNHQSRDIEDFYKFYFSGKRLDFEYQGDIIDDIKIFKNLSCFTGGKAYLALNTKYFPKCIEFENMNLNNFSYTDKSDPNIYIKFYIYKIRNNKIHLHALKKQIINENLLKRYNILENGMSYNNGRNIIVYREENYNYLRICNIIPDIEYPYENKFWFEISWNPKIQNLICFKNYKYIYY